MPMHHVRSRPDAASGHVHVSACPALVGACPTREGAGDHAISFECCSRYLREVKDVHHCRDATHTHTLSHTHTNTPTHTYTNTQGPSLPRPYRGTLPIRNRLPVGPYSRALCGPGGAQFLMSEIPLSMHNLCNHVTGGRDVRCRQGAGDDSVSVRSSFVLKGRRHGETLL